MVLSHPDKDKPKILYISYSRQTLQGGEGGREGEDKYNNLLAIITHFIPLLIMERTSEKRAASLSLAKNKMGCPIPSAELYRIAQFFRGAIIS